ncbi:uncharacterized protein LOC115882036 [Sitophilus oryzae]|uniref:Uncharacterized protein LOC115882036 n=1 Tax=Sitophilus oryzae TaxID=7048 RepID=A0A6J2XY84_SITOR|nr:uncharacterized protein LOC115882036 [Sitophilus oryzae]
MDYLRDGYASFSTVLSQYASLVQAYFWYLFFGSILFYYVYNKFVRPSVHSAFRNYVKYKDYRKEKEYEAKYHKNPDLFSARLSAQQDHAQKLQEKYNKQLQEHEAKMREKAELKRQEVENLLNQSGQAGHRLGGPDGQSRTLRSDYNPLMGPGSHSNYRPPKRSKCGGGGCGR